MSFCLDEKKALRQSTKSFLLTALLRLQIVTLNVLALTLILQFFPWQKEAYLCQALTSPT